MRTHSQRRHSRCAFFLQTECVYKEPSHALAVRRGAQQKSTLVSRPESADSEANTEAHKCPRCRVASPWGRGSCASSSPLQREAEESTTGPCDRSDVTGGQLLPTNRRLWQREDDLHRKCDIILGLTHLIVNFLNCLHL